MTLLRIAIFVLAAAALVSIPGAAKASGTNATLGVSVTVVRPCAVQASPAGSHASVRLSCAAATGGSRVLVGNTPTAGRLAPPTGEVQVAQPSAPGADGGLRVVTLNF